MMAGWINGHAGLAQLPARIVIEKNDPTVARREFLGWQCRIRQRAVRQTGGRPSPGMRPRVSVPPDEKDLGHIVVLIRKKVPQEATARFQHMVRKTRDPAERRESALRFLAAAYYQRPDEFSDQMTALFAPRSALAERLLDAAQCTLGFEQFGQRYRLRCRVNRLADSDPAYQFTYWHNSLFNPAIPGEVQIIGFKPEF